MNILHITINPIFLERRILNQVRSAIQHSHVVSVIYLEEGSENSGIANRDYTQIPLRTSFHRGGPLKFLQYNWKVLWAGLNHEFDIIHAHDLWILPAATILSVWKKKVLLYDAHEYYPGLEIFTRRKIRRLIWTFSEKICIRRVKNLITVSEPLGQLYRDRYHLSISVDVIRNLPAYEAPSPAKVVKIPVNDDMLTVLYHGHFRPGRGLTNLIKAIARVENIRLVLIGGGELESELKKLTYDLNAEKRVSFIPYILTDQLISTAAQADIGAVLFEPGSQNYAHALPNKIFEYVMAGLPVLASNIDTLDHYVNKYNLGITTDPNDVQSISDCLEEISGNQNQLQIWHNNALSAARELSWENEAEKLINIYDKFKSK
jgi:glycosyltransferase involved in cell wall biosynthesis